MRIVVASGKGGTGKTTVATSLALVGGESVRCLDCDVEAPNAALFLHPVLDRRQEVGIPLPRVDTARCTHCGKCAEVCQYHAIAVLGQTTLVFPELCHGCGSCTRLCPEGAISEHLHVTGVLEGGLTADGLEFARGLLQVGEPMAVPIIRELKRWPPRRRPAIEIWDAPPGASCPVVETLRGADFALLVTEPTPFGLHDLKQVVGIARELKIPAGVVVNRDGIGDQAVDAYCADQGLPILLRIPMERRIAEGLARGRSLLETAPDYRPAFQTLLAAIQDRVNAEYAR
ncbi:ATP-binding protein [uncultured Lamprocystis sp.]|jgi:MinD superfamily P-loop ATPase|uniref:ATP-binding protein n=1 Tax=uncultured Lamprocystis sp. TaxID=543132 RepID=UPI0025CDEFA8|nr:ATP-binding protein [uncultured Lamprocystis sp.]